MPQFSPLGLPRVCCSATVDWVPSIERLPKGVSLYRVHVWGRASFAYSRFYDIKAGSEDAAAKQGLALFTAEVEKAHVARTREYPVS
jgi:hypothetical protein